MEEATMKKYGFLGLGIMGEPMVDNLLKAGFEVCVWNRTAEKCAPLIKKGASQGKSPADVARQCEITFAMVSDPEAAHALCFGRDGVVEGIGQGRGYVDISTVDPETSKEIGAAVSAAGGSFLEAPVSGSKKPAEDGTLVFLCAGDEQLYKDAGGAFEAMGKTSFFLGETGRGAEMKLIVNMIMGVMMVGFSEGLSLGKAAGLKPEDILQVLSQGAIDNPMFRLKGPLMVDGNFSPAFPLKHMQKDMRLALLLGDCLSQSLSTSASANAAFIKARGEGSAEEDFSAVFRTIVGG
jgi:3-hydroxyisobutyrate dehydrogenase-like beta-hydroxyacid dehydrogenase